MSRSDWLSNFEDDILFLNVFKKINDLVEEEKFEELNLSLIELEIERLEPKSQLRLLSATHPYRALLRDWDSVFGVIDVRLMALLKE